MIMFAALLLSGFAGHTLCGILQDRKDVTIFFHSKLATYNESRSADQKQNARGPGGSILWQRVAGLADSDAFQCLSNKPPAYLDDYRLHNVLGVIQHAIAGIGPRTRNFLREGQGHIRYAICGE